MGEYPQGSADGPQSEINLQYVLSNFLSVYGTPYTILRIPMPPDGFAYPDQGGDYITHANMTFVNCTVLVPVYNTSYDAPALDKIRETLPESKVYGINVNQM